VAVAGDRLRPAGHVNNAIGWAAAEDMLADLDWLASLAELEYHRPILPGVRPRLLTRASPAEAQLWLLDGDERLATGRLSR
jgi:hypothetical protein